MTWRDEDDAMKPPIRSTPSWGVYYYYWLSLHQPPMFRMGVFHSHYFCSRLADAFCMRGFILFYSLSFHCPFTFRVGGGFIHSSFFCCLCPAPFAFCMGWILFFDLLPAPSHLVHYFYFIKFGWVIFFIVLIIISSFVYVINCQESTGTSTMGISLPVVPGYILTGFLRLARDVERRIFQISLLVLELKKCMYDEHIYMFWKIGASYSLHRESSPTQL